jgi:hypothetical protein
MRREAYLRCLIVSVRTASSSAMDQLYTRHSIRCPNPNPCRRGRSTPFWASAYWERGYTNVRECHFYILG